jgi:hypothetical protein
MDDRNGNGQQGGEKREGMFHGLLTRMSGVTLNIFATLWHFDWLS